MNSISTGFILERGFVGFPQFKKIPHTIYIGASNGAHKTVPKWGAQNCGIKYLKTSLTIRLIWPPLYTSKFIASLCLNCLSLLCLCSYSALYWVASSMHVSDNNNKKKPEKVTVCKRQMPLQETNIQDSAVNRVQAFSVAPFLGPLCWKKAP